MVANSVLTEAKPGVGALPCCLVADGLHRANLVAVQRFSNAHGPRIAFVFELADGKRLMASAAPSTNPRSKVAELLRGLLGRDPSNAELGDPTRLERVRCQILVRTEANKSSRSYSNVVTVFR